MNRMYKEHGKNKDSIFFLPFILLILLFHNIIDYLLYFVVLNDNSISEYS